MHWSDGRYLPSEHIGAADTPRHQHVLGPRASCAGMPHNLHTLAHRTPVHERSEQQDLKDVSVLAQAIKTLEAHLKFSAVDFRFYFMRPAWWVALTGTRQGSVPALFSFVSIHMYMYVCVVSGCFFVFSLFV